MFAKGELVFYGNSGICKVLEVGKISRMGCDVAQEYYTLQPMFGKEIICIPTDTTVYMRPALTLEEVKKLVAEIPHIQEADCTQRNQTLLREQYQAAFATHRCEDLAMLVKSLYAKTQKAREQGKKAGRLDQQTMLRAEKLLHEELAAVLEIAPDQVAAYISQAEKDLEQSDKGVEEA